VSTGARSITCEHIYPRGHRFGTPHRNSHLCQDPSPRDQRQPAR
jgi:hypothetical protein